MRVPRGSESALYITPRSWSMVNFTESRLARILVLGLSAKVDTSVLVVEYTSYCTSGVEESLSLLHDMRHRATVKAIDRYIDKYFLIFFFKKQLAKLQQKSKNRAQFVQLKKIRQENALFSRCKININTLMNIY